MGRGGAMILTGYINGIKGNTGRGIASIVENNDYTITINLTDSTSYTTAPIAGFTAVAFDENYDLVVTKTDGTEVTVETDLGDYEDLLAGYKSDAEDAKADAETAQTYAETAKSGADASALKAEQWAKGTKNGTPVTSGDDGYNDNSKYYKEQAASSASSASSSASSAGADALAAEGIAYGEQNGEGVDSSSPYYQNNAKYFRDQAYGSKTAAATSESNAASSESDAKAYAIGKRGDSNVGSSDPAYHNNSKYYAGEASSSASSASGSATSAETDALKAEGYAVGKQNGTDVTSGSTYYENNAKYYAGEAADSATAAAASAASLTVDSALSGSSTNPVQNKVIKTELDKKANVDGAYEQMTVGNAEQLVSTIYEKDSVPYLFRTSGGSIDIGDREYDEIVGGTVAWNQLVPTDDKDSTNTVTDSRAFRIQFRRRTSPYTSAFAIDNVGKGLFTRIFNGVDTGGGGVSLNHNGAINNIQIWLSETQNLIVGHKYLLSLYVVDNDTSVVGGLVTDNLMLFDLTQMFGSTIADHIYTLETNNAGAGVAWFKKLFPKSYYAYNAGELMSVNVSAHNTVGFNQWDEEWELGGINNQDGSTYSANDRIRSKNYIPCLPNTTYYWKSPNKFGAIAYYDGGKNFVSAIGNANNNYARTTPSEAHYMKFQLETAYGTTYKNDVCINFHWDGERDGEYEEYVEHEYPLDSSLTLRGIPKLDANNNLYYDGDTYESDGTVTRKYGYKSIESDDVIYVANNSGYSNIAYAKVAKPTGAKDKGVASINARHSKYTTDSAVSDWDNASKIGSFFGGAEYNFYWFGFAYGTTIEQMKTALNGTSFFYELATQSTETATGFTNPQIVDDFGTEEYVDTRSVPIPVGHNTKYAPNLRAKLEMSPNSPSGDGDYLVRQTSGLNEYVQFVPELPAKPSTNGTYVLKATVSGGVATLTWEEES